MSIVHWRIGLNTCPPQRYSLDFDSECCSENCNAKVSWWCGEEHLHVDSDFTVQHGTAGWNRIII